MRMKTIEELEKEIDSLKEIVSKLTNYEETTYYNIYWLYHMLSLILDILVSNRIIEKGKLIELLDERYPGLGELFINISDTSNIRDKLLYEITHVKH